MNRTLLNRRYALAAMLLPCLTGCLDLLKRDYYGDYRRPPQRLHEIETLRLEDRSRTAPVTIEQAATNAVEEVATAAQPPESIDLTLAEVRTAALANNLGLKVEFVNPSVAEQSIGVEEARFEALLFGSVSQNETDRPPAVKDGLGARSQSTAIDAGVRIPLRTGGEITIDLPISRFDDKSADSSGAAAIDPSYETALRFSISQPLLRNAGVRTNTHAIRVAKYGRDITDARTKLETIRILANADRAYWLLYAARRELEVRLDQYELARQQLTQAQQRVAAGAAPQIEIMRAESGVARRLEAIIITDTGVKFRERDLKRIMNRDDLPIESPTALRPMTEPNPLGLDLDAPAMADYAVANRMEMLELEIQLAIDASAIDFEKNGALPLFVLDYSYTINGFSGSFNAAFRDLGRNAYVDHAVTLRAEIPLGNQAAKSRVRRAVLERAQRLATRAQRRLAIRQEVFDALDSLQQDWQRILAARRDVVLAGRTYEAEKKQFEVGLRTSTDVLEAAAFLADAQSREIRALSAYEISQVDIAFAAGALVGKDRVIWEPAGIE